MKRISLREIPNCQRDPPTWFEDSKHLLNRLNGSGKEHHSKTAYDCFEAMGVSRQSIGLRHGKSGIAEALAVRLPARGFHHLRNWVYAEDFAFVSNEFGNR